MSLPNKIERIKAKKEELEKQLVKLQAEERAKTRKEETRLKVLIGGGILADSKKHPEIIDLIQEIMGRATTAQRDKDFLKEKGWMPEKQGSGQ